VSEGCRNCYAERVAARFSGPGLAYEGLATITPSGPRWTGKVSVVEEHMLDPTRWRMPRMIFVNSMSDLFYEALDPMTVARIFAVMAFAGWHRFQVLTKRPTLMQRLLSSDSFVELVRSWKATGGLYPAQVYESQRDMPWPLPNVWVGVSVEDQETANERIPLLLKTPAATRFISYEPALGPLDLTKCFPQFAVCRTGEDGKSTKGAFTPEAVKAISQLARAGLKQMGAGVIDWLICGGESGPGARPMHPDWARSVRDQCRAAGIAFFFKQWGEWLPFEGRTGSDRQDAMVTHTGRVQTFPFTGDQITHDELPAVRMTRVGKKTAGRRLDGREWNEFPRVS
jgi:protein gp37